MSEQPEPPDLSRGMMQPMPNTFEQYNRPSLHAIGAALDALMRGEHLPAAVEAREERDRARETAVALEQENAELRTVIRELLDDQEQARRELLDARVNARARLNKLETL